MSRVVKVIICFDLKLGPTKNLITNIALKDKVVKILETFGSSQVFTIIIILITSTELFCAAIPFVTVFLLRGSYTVMDFM